MQMLPWLLLLCVTSVSSTARPRLGVFMRGTEMKTLQDYSGYESFFYTQTLDHFNYRPESYDTFQQKYVVDSTYWGGANTSSPIFVWLGDESSLATGIGFMVDNAPHFKALLVYIEHRYYGDSMPFGSEEEAFKNTSTRGYFSSTQALADYAEVIINLKANLSAENCPVIVIGGSYGGMLAAWFRLKYPHIAMGALASSAPILYFEDLTPQNGYYVVVSKDFQEASASCYNTIKASWDEIDKVAAGPNGLTVLSQIFNTCYPLNSSDVLKGNLETMYMASAQYNSPPDYPVNMICDIIDGMPEGSNILSRVVAVLNASRGNGECNEMEDIRRSNMSGWDWQSCTEMVMPIGNNGNDTMFQVDPFNIKNFTQECQDLFGVTPRPYWATTEFGGRNITSVLKKFGSNIIFSNGLRDPYSSGGVLENISRSVVALRTSKGSHCLDLYMADPYDPKWLVAQRAKEIKIVERWIANYNNRLNNKTS